MKLAMNSALDRAFAPLQNALDLRAYRQQLLAANMANANTPHYKAVDLDFTSALQSALNGQGSPLPMKLEQPGQLETINTANPATNFVAYQAGNSVRLDGNSVDMGREQASFQKNSIQYEADLTFLTGKIKTLTSAITGN
jgi:flagellar basal-body rod protein FlgB